ncbi:DUF5994 family protein [Streptomyces griseus]|uniref:DUF5994 family protein n=1 Tax=Streptomyces griseus TaxID=1911 RepID=UPI001F48F848|nr:DUF5994 family protein [Streptomyces griseus]
MPAKDELARRRHCHARDRGYRRLARCPAQEVMAPGHVIEVALSNGAAEMHAITVDCGTVGRWELLVVPPDEPAGTAALLLTAASNPENPLSAPRLLALAESGLDGQDTWSRKEEPDPGKQHRCTRRARASTTP